MFTGRDHGLLAELRKIRGIKVKKRASVELAKVIRSIVKIRSDGTVTGAKSKVAAKKVSIKKPAVALPFTAAPALVTPDSVTSIAE